MSDEDVVHHLLLSERYHLVSLLDAVVDDAYRIDSQTLSSIHKYSEVSLETRFCKIATKRMQLLEDGMRTVKFSTGTCKICVPKFKKTFDACIS